MRPRAWFRVHSWLGVITGLLLFVICWSGTVATLSHEVDGLLLPHHRALSDLQPLPLEALYEPLRRAHPDATVQSLRAPLDSGFAAWAIISTPQQKLQRVFLDPGTGEVLGSSSFFNSARFFRSFHIALFNGKWGLYLVWMMAIPLTVSLVAPLLFYKRWWTRFFTWKTGRGARVFWSDAHKVVGLWVWWFGLVIAVTSLWFLLEALRLDVGDGKWSRVGDGSSAVVRLPVIESTPPLPLHLLMAKARQARPDIEIRTISFLRSGYLLVDGQSSHWLVRDRANKLYLNARDGRVVHNQKASDLSAYWRWSDTADPLHFGDFGGLASKLVWFVFGLGLCGLCLTGAYLHAQRLATEAGSKQRARWAGTGATVVATALVLLASVRGAWLEIKKLGLVIEGVQHWPEVPWPVTVFILVWVVMTLAILAFWTWLVWQPCLLKKSLPLAPDAQVAKELQSP